MLASASTVIFYFPINLNYLWYKYYLFPDFKQKHLSNLWAKFSCPLMHIKETSVQLSKKTSACEDFQQDTSGKYWEKILYSHAYGLQFLLLRLRTRSNQSYCMSPDCVKTMYLCPRRLSQTKGFIVRVLGGDLFCFAVFVLEIVRLNYLFKRNKMKMGGL